MGTPTHMFIAKRILQWYPKLLHDIYLSEEYYGENVLHMAAVAEVIMGNYRIEKCCNCETSPGSINCKMAP